MPSKVFNIFSRKRVGYYNNLFYNRECCRNFGLGDKNVKYELKTLKHQKNEVIMTVGKHTVQVPCKNKRDGKQRAAQAILQVHCKSN